MVEISVYYSFTITVMVVGVMFLQVSVCPQSEGTILQWDRTPSTISLLDHTPGTVPPVTISLLDHIPRTIPLATDTWWWPPHIWLTSGQYASNWNTFPCSMPLWKLLAVESGSCADLCGTDALSNQRLMITCTHYPTFAKRIRWQESFFPGRAGHFKTDS